MKTSTVIAAAAFSLLAAASTARADDQILVKVPFDFAVGSVHMTAGNYIVKEMSNDPSVFEIQSADHRQAAYTLTIPMSPDAPANKPELIFTRHGNSYVLSRVIGPDGSEREIPGGKP